MQLLQWLRLALQLQIPLSSSRIPHSISSAASLSTELALKQQLSMFLPVVMSHRAERHRCRMFVCTTREFCMWWCLILAALSIAFIKRLYFPLCSSYGMHLHFYAIAKLNFFVLERHNIKKIRYLWISHDKKAYSKWLGQAFILAKPVLIIFLKLIYPSTRPSVTGDIF